MFGKGHATCSSAATDTYPKRHFDTYYYGIYPYYNQLYPFQHDDKNRASYCEALYINPE